MSEKKEVYEDYVRGDISEEKARKVLGGDFRERRELVNLMTETPNREPSDDLFD